jgi:flagellar protein FliJ
MGKGKATSLDDDGSHSEEFPRPERAFSVRGVDGMKSRDNLVRLRRFQVEEKRRRVVQIELMIGEFDRISADLEREIAVEEQRSGISDPSHFAYPTYAKASRQRRDNLRRSADELKLQLEDAKAELGEAFEDLRKAEVLEDRERSSERGFTARDAAMMSEAAGARAARTSP